MIIAILIEAINTVTNEHVSRLTAQGATEDEAIMILAEPKMAAQIRDETKRLYDMTIAQLLERT